MDTILTEIEEFCAKHQLRESRFGREAVNDTSFVPGLREGREPRRRTVQRVQQFMAAYAASADARAPRERGVAA
ncbi:hypothetical protein [Sphingobium abikonense]|uniref:hypothetical protein n=1 Tax=Sphingobium abikonense TaxID=86193 RepID=UPI0035111374